MNVAFLSLGGNLLDRANYLKKAVEAIRTTCGKVLQLSSVYETEAWGFESRHKYLNQVLKIQTELNPLQLLNTIQKIELELERKRDGIKNSDRTMDIDLLFYNQMVVKTETLTLPHPRIHLRKFILIPLSEIDGNLIHPLLNKKISILLKTCKDKLQVKLYHAPSPPKYICIEGNIGSGKSTLAKALSKKLGATYLPEEYQGMRLLPLFYSNPKLYAFSLEFSFLVNRFEQIADCFNRNKGLVISDFSIYKSLCFAKVNLKKAEYDIFNKQYESLFYKLPQPDLIIHLNTSTTNLLGNIRKRGRPFEQTISAAYLEALRKAYDKGFGELTQISQIHIVVKKYNAELEKSLIKNIVKHLKENFG